MATARFLKVDLDEHRSVSVGTIDEQPDTLAVRFVHSGEGGAGETKFSLSRQAMRVLIQLARKALDEPMRFTVSESGEWVHVDAAAPSKS